MTFHSDMENIDHWPYDNIVQFAKDAASDRNRLLAANITLANSEVVALQHLRALLTEFEEVCDQFAKKPNRSKAYREAKKLLK